MARPTYEERQAQREQENALLRAFGYHWTRKESLQGEQIDVLYQIYWELDQREIPDWVLLSPKEQPVEKEGILCWLGQETTPASVFAFLEARGFVNLGKNAQQHWQIKTPSGNIVTLKSALQELEQVRRDEARRHQQEQEQQRKQRFEQCILSLKTLQGEALNETSAWGYAPQPHAKRLANGHIEVTTYLLEGEWDTRVLPDEAGVVSYLYFDGEGYWIPTDWIAC